jgi:enamine deaminase RidA (YjgF/YER057c/UK114 family)
MTDEGKIVEGDIVAQFVQAFGNVLTALDAAGGNPSDLIDVTIYLTDIPDYQAHARQIGRRWREMAGTEYPAMAGIGVVSLWQAEALIEIQAVAYIGEQA